MEQLHFIVDYSEEVIDMPEIGSKVSIKKNNWGIAEGTIKYVVGYTDDYIELTTDRDGEVDFLCDVRNWRNEIKVIN